MWGWISYDPELDLIFYGTANPGPWNPELRPGDNKWTSGTCSRAARTRARPCGPISTSPHDLYDHDGINEHLAARPADRRPAAQGARAPERNGHMYVFDRHERRSAVGQAVRASSTPATGVDLKTGRLQIRAGKEAVDRQGRARHLPGGAGRRRTGSRRPTHRAPGCCTFRTEPVQGRGGTRGELHRRHAVRRREREDVRRAGRQSRRVQGVGPGGRRKRSGRSRRTFRCGAARWSPPATSSSTARWTAGSRRSNARTGDAAVAVQDRLGNHRPADDVQGARRQAVRGGAVGRRRLGGRDRRRRPGSHAIRPRRSGSSTP